MPLNDDLARILALAQAEVDMTKGAGEVPDPRYASLAEVLTEKCRECGGWGHVEWLDERTFIRSKPGCASAKCPTCHGSGRVLRSWEDLPQGALAGIEMTWLMRAYIEHNLIWAHKVAVAFWTNGGWTEEDPNATLTQDILEAMQKEASHAQT